MADRRAERMGNYLRGAMMELLQEKPIEQITVRGLVDRAGVSKNSFYAHYGNLCSLVEDCLLHESIFFGPPHKRRADFANRQEAIWTRLDQSADQLSLFKANPNLARVVMLNVGISPYFHELEQAEEELTYDHLLFEYGPPNPDALISYDEWAYLIFIGTYGIYRRWVQDGMVADIETVVKKAALFSLHTTAGCAGRPIEPDYRAAIEAWSLNRASQGVLAAIPAEEPLGTSPYPSSFASRSSTKPAR